MLKIGRLKLHGDGKWPESRVTMKKELRSFAKGLGLELDFVSRQKKTASWTKISKGRSLVCESVGGTDWPMSKVMFFALHEIAHWIQFNEGMFQKYFGRPYYDLWTRPAPRDLRRLSLRAERHANWLARRIGVELFGVPLMVETIYDRNDEAKDFLKEHYEL